MLKGAWTLVLMASLTSCAVPLRGSRSTPPLPVSVDEHALAVAGLRPPKRARPLVAVIGDSAGTETTDFLLPYAVLSQSNVADVVALGTSAGAMTLMPALKMLLPDTLAAFEVRHPDGADYVVVPAMHVSDNPQILAFVKEQHLKGATIVGICSGVKILSNAGLLRDRRATGHWFDADGLRKDNPGMQWVADRRYVVDRGVVTTTGITASMPVSLALVEAMAGPERAAALAAQLGVPGWDAQHDSAAFGLTARLAWTLATNKLAVWGQEDIALPLEAGMDDAALALAADAYSRTYRSQAVTTSNSRAPVRTRSGLLVVPDRISAAGDGAWKVTQPPRPLQVLDAALQDISQRYGERTAEWVATQMEYPHVRGGGK